MTDSEWKTIVYNMALLAAWAVDDTMPDGIIMLMDHVLPEN